MYVSLTVFFLPIIYKILVYRQAKMRLNPCFASLFITIPLI